MYSLPHSVHIKMKDTFVYSFRETEPLKVSKALRKEEKDLTISGRKMDELNRVPMPLTQILD